jgi:hypothetical protein
MLINSKNGNAQTNLTSFALQVITSAALACLGEYSHANNLAKRMIGMYMYASGAQRQSISVLSTLGLSESYSSLVSKNLRRVRILEKKSKAEEKEKTPKHSEEGLGEGEKGECSLTEKDVSKVPTGTLYQLSEYMRQETRKVAATGLFATVYDNININFRNPEEIIGRHGEQPHSLFLEFRFTLK